MPSDLSAIGVKEGDLVKLHAMCLTYVSHKDFRIKTAIQEIGKPVPIPNVTEESDSHENASDNRGQEDASEARPGPSGPRKGITWSLENVQVRTIPSRTINTERRTGAYQNRVIRQMNSMALEERRRLVATHVLSRGIISFCDLRKNAHF